MDLVDLYELKKYLLLTKEKIVNRPRTKETDNRLFVINITLDNLEKKITEAKELTTYC